MGLPLSFVDDYEVLAIGGEKIVCHDPHDAKRVICFFKPGYRKESKRFIKARFYLTNILHLLFPQNIPEMIWTGYKPLAYASEKMETDQEHQEFNRLATRYRAGEYRLAEQLCKLQEEHHKKRGSSYRGLQELFHRLEISFDAGVVNFAFSPEGDVIYLGHFSPWYLPRGEGYGVKELFNYPKIKQEMRLLEPEVKIRAEKLLARLLALFEEEKAEFGDYEKIGKI